MTYTKCLELLHFMSEGMRGSGGRIHEAHYTLDGLKATVRFQAVEYSIEIKATRALVGKEDINAIGGQGIPSQPVPETLREQDGKKDA